MDAGSGFTDAVSTERNRPAERHLSAAPEIVDAPVGAGAVQEADGPGSRDGAWGSITACPDGPLLVRGDVDILLADGSAAPRRRRTVALCRCGASGIKPYCDGSHKVIGFTTEDEPTTAAAQVGLPGS